MITNSVHKNNSFVGIDAESVYSLGPLRQVVQIAHLQVRWHGGLIGNNGSHCPFLLPLPPLIEYWTFMLHGMFDTGDGIVNLLANISNASVQNELHIARLLLTDSGRYLLPVDCSGDQTDEESDLAIICTDAFMKVTDSLKQLLGPGGLPKRGQHQASLYGCSGSEAFISQQDTDLNKDQCQVSSCQPHGCQVTTAYSHSTVSEQGQARPTSQHYKMQIATACKTKDYWTNDAKFWT